MYLATLLCKNAYLNYVHSSVFLCCLVCTGYLRSLCVHFLTHRYIVTIDVYITSVSLASALVLWFSTTVLQSPIHTLIIHSLSASLHHPTLHNVQFHSLPACGQGLCLYLLSCHLAINKTKAIMVKHTCLNIESSTIKANH